MRSLREGNFDLYTEAIAELLLFVNNSICNGYWLTVIVADMMSLEEGHPHVVEFHKGYLFCVNPQKDSLP